MQDLAALENELAALRADNAALTAENTGQLALVASLQAALAEHREVVRELEARVGRRNEQIGLHQRDIARLETNLRLAEDALEDVEEMRRKRECAVEDGRQVREERDDLVRRLEEAEERCEELKRRLAEDNSVAGLTGLLSPAIVGDAQRVRSSTPMFLAVPPPPASAPPQQKTFVETEVDATGAYDYIDTSRDPVAATANFDFDLSNLRRSILSSSLDFRPPGPRPSTQAVDGHGVDDTMEFVLSGGRAGSGATHAAATYDFLDLQTSIASAYPATANGGSVRADSVFTQQLPGETRSMEVQMLLGQLEDARAEIARLRVQVQQQDVTEELARARAELAVLRAKMPVEDAMREVEALQAQLEEARAELDEARAHAQDADDLRAKLDATRADLEDARAQLGRLRGRMQVEDATRDLAELTRRVEADALAAEIAAREDEARALVGVVFDIVARQRREVVHAKERPASYMRLSELVVVPRGDETVAWKIGELRDHLVQLEQEIHDLHATLGDAKEHAREMERELNETNGALLDARAELLKKVLDLADRGTQDTTQVDTLRADLETARALSADLESKMETLANNLRAARAKNEQERLAHRKKVLELEIAADDAQERVGELEARVEELEAAEQRVTELEGRVGELEPAAVKVTELEGRVVELRVVEMRVAELGGAVVRAAELEVLVGELEAKQGVLMKQLEGGQAVLRKAEAGNVELEDDVRGLQAELARGVTEREELEHRLGRMDDELMMLRARIIDRDTELAGLSGQLHRAKLDLEDAQERAAKAIELRGRVDVLEADLKTKDEEAEESYDKLLECVVDVPPSPCG
ncbi:hypothetical protein AURDEDRAFT_170981 [Auricularia subglabra TFB-10046 SS5]|nr:hypothetical protein AURDEDRAFT_170981 [Auricularia subglabra TFB-10046 SS5]